MARLARQSDAVDATPGAPTPRESGDELWRQISGNGEVTVLCVEGSELVREMRARHGTSATAGVALGRTLLGTLLLGAFKGPDEQTQVTFTGRGPLGTIKAIATHDCQVRGLVTNPHIDLPPRADGQLNVEEAVGPGTVAVVRSHPSWKEPFTGIVQIRDGGIATDLTHYMSDSEQQNGALGLGVQVKGDGEVLGAQGYMVQVLPFASEETLTQLEANLAAMPPPSQIAARGIRPDQVALMLLEGLQPEEGYAQSFEPRYGPCCEDDIKRRMRRAVATLPPQEVDEIFEDVGYLEVNCEFCKVSARWESQAELDADSPVDPEEEAETDGAAPGAK
eukprot:PRCOL_00000376-RA